MNEKLNDNIEETTGGIYIDSFESYDVVTEIDVSPKNSMSAIYKLYAIGNSDIYTEIIAIQVKNSDIYTTISPRVTGTDIKETVIDIVYGGYSDILTEIQPAVIYNILTEIEIRPNNRMSAIYEVQQPPIITDNKTPIKDAFTRDYGEYRSINYGHTMSMVVGNDGNITSRSYIGFDLRFSESFVFNEAKLKIYYSGVRPKEDILNLYTSRDIWFENSITHLNRPRLGELVSSEYTINEDEGYVEFDVKDFVEKVSKGEIENRGFILTLKDESEFEEIIFRTKESMQSPELIVKYYDSRVYSAGRSQIYTELTVMIPDESDILTEIEVNSTYGFNNINTEIYVHRPEDYMHDDKETVLIVSRERIPIDIIVSISDRDDVLTEITVTYSKNNEVDTNIYVSREFTFIEMIARQVVNSDIFTNISSTRKELLTEIDVVYGGSDEIITEITVENAKKIDSEITISRERVFTEITPRLSRLNEISTIIIPNRQNVATEIYVKYYDVILTEIDAKQKHDIYTEINVNREQINTELTIRQKDESNIDTEIFVYYREEIDTEIDVRVFNQVLTEIEAIISSRVDTVISISRPSIYAEIVIPYVDDSDVLTEIRPRIFTVNNMETEITVIGVSKGKSYTYII